MSRMIVSVCLALVLASACYADTTVALITSWEDGGVDGLNSNGWGDTLVGGQTVGVTDGSYSLGVVAPVQWNFVGEMDISSFAGAFMNSHYIEMDVTALASNFVGDCGFNMDLFIQGDRIPSTEVDNVMPSWYCGSGNGGSGNVTATMKVDISGIVASLGGVAPSWLQILPIINSYTADGEMTTTVLYFDNLRLCTPEPATMALLGLGGLALIRRKK